MPLDPFKYLTRLAVKAAGTVVSHDAKSINFTGSGQSTTASNDEVTVDISGGGGSSGGEMYLLYGSTPSYTFDGSKQFLDAGFDSIQLATDESYVNLGAMPEELQLSNDLDGSMAEFTALEDGIWEVGIFFTVPNGGSSYLAYTIIESVVDWPLNLACVTGGSAAGISPNLGGWAHIALNEGQTFKMRFGVEDLNGVTGSGILCLCYMRKI